MSVNGFAEADFRNLPSSVINARLLAVQAGINARLAGTAPNIAEAYVINGRTQTLTSLEYLTTYENALYRALNVQAVEPDGLGIGLAQMGDPSGAGSGLPNNAGPGRPSSF
jgi:hypothetical protein